MAMSSAELEREAAAARQKLAATLDQLRENLAPGRLVDEVLGRVGGGGHAASMFKRVESGIRSYPLPSMLVGIGSALFLGSNWTKKLARPVPDDGQASLELGDLDGKSMRDNVAAVGHSVTDTAYNTLKLRAAQKIEDVTKAATAGVGAASGQVLNAAEAMIDHALGRVSAKVERRPLAFSVIAVAIGAAVGAALLGANGKDD